MPNFLRLWQRLYLSIATLSWSVLAAAFITHALLSWLLLWLAGEIDLTSDGVTFAYYYMTTATTVGYGDLSPGGKAGRLADILVVLPGSIALFTSVLGKAISDVSGFWRRRLQGFGNFSDRQGHTLVVGWQGPRSQRLIEGLLIDQAKGERIVLLATDLAENPVPDAVDFVLATEVSHLESYERAGAAGAATVVIRGADDDETLAATLAARSAAPDAHIVAHFQDDGAANLVRRQFPDVEVLTSIAAELIVRCARDPGASRLADLMFSDRTEDTAYSMKVPAGIAAMRYFDMFCSLKQRYDLSLIGICRSGETHVDLNCKPGCEVAAGDTLFYISDTRCDAGRIEWAAMQREAAR